MPTLALGEWRPDVADYQQEHSRNITNVVARGDGYGPIKGLQSFSAALPAPCRGAFLATNTDGSIAVFAATATNLYLLNNTTLAWTDVTRASGGNYTLAPLDQWQYVQFGDDVIVVNQNDAPQVYTLGVSTKFAALGGSPPLAAYIAVVSSHVVLSGLLNNPDRVAWCGLNNDTQWTAGVGGADTQDFQDGGETQGVAGGEHGVVFQTEAIRHMAFVGGDTIFEFERIVEGEGLAAPYSIIRSGPRVFFLGTSGFQSITSGQYPSAISKERFHRTFLSDYDDGSPHLMIGANEPRASRVWWFYKNPQGIAGRFNRAIVYDWALDKPSYVTGISGEYPTSLAQPGVTLEGLDTNFGFTNIDTMQTSLDDFTAGSGRLLSVVGADHKMGFLTGANLEAIVETADFAFDKRYTVRGQRPITDADMVYGSMTVRQRIADQPVHSGESLMNRIGLCPHHSDTRMSRFMLRIPSGTIWSYATGTEPDAVSTGQQ